MVGRKPLPLPLPPVGVWERVGVRVGVSGLEKLLLGLGEPVLLLWWWPPSAGELARVLLALDVGVASGVVLRWRMDGKVACGGGSWIGGGACSRL
jgi:hypothetical protein